MPCFHSGYLLPYWAGTLMRVLTIVTEACSSKARPLGVVTAVKIVPVTFPTLSGVSV